jgi:hypothetical protein
MTIKVNAASDMHPQHSNRLVRLVRFVCITMSMYFKDEANSISIKYSIYTEQLTEVFAKIIIRFSTSP